MNESPSQSPPMPIGFSPLSFEIPRSMETDDISEARRSEGVTQLNIGRQSSSYPRNSGRLDNQRSEQTTPTQSQPLLNTSFDSVRLETGDNSRSSNLNSPSTSRANTNSTRTATSRRAPRSQGIDDYPMVIAERVSVPYAVAYVMAVKQTGLPSSPTNSKLYVELCDLLNDEAKGDYLQQAIEYVQGSSSKPKMELLQEVPGEYANLKEMIQAIDEHDPERFASFSYPVLLGIQATKPCANLATGPWEWNGEFRNLVVETIGWIYQDKSTSTGVQVSQHRNILRFTEMSWLNILRRLKHMEVQRTLTNRKWIFLYVTKMEPF